MNSNFLLKMALLTLSVFAIVATTYAGTGQPANGRAIIRYAAALTPGRDTLPDVKTIPEAKADSASTTSVIKEVPKSKKQLAPLAVPATVKIKPINIIKPKIIKPVIRIN